MTESPRKLRLLFVCMGNICRSPAAEGIMRKMVAEAGLEDQIECDSAGTIGYHRGSPPDHRMTTTAAEYGYQLGGSSRPIEPEDLGAFDLILTMDADNLAAVRHLDRNRRFTDKVVSICRYCTQSDDREVPDPYYGGNEGFHRVIRLLEDACAGLLATLRKQHSL